MMQIEQALAFRLPDGAFVTVKATEGVVGASDTDSRHWRSLDVMLIHPDGMEDILCAVDFEDKKGLRTLVFDSENDEPIFEHTAYQCREVEK